MLSRYKNFSALFEYLNKFLKFVIISIILYLRPLFFIKNCCKYNITCTVYAKSKLKDEKNLIKALILITKRFILCGYETVLFIILIYFILIFFLY